MIRVLVYCHLELPFVICTTSRVLSVLNESYARVLGIILAGMEHSDCVVFMVLFSGILKVVQELLLPLLRSVGSCVRRLFGCLFFFNLLKTALIALWVSAMIPHFFSTIPYLPISSLSRCGMRKILGCYVVSVRIWALGFFSLLAPWAHCWIS